MGSEYDFIIIGGGIIGLSTAYQLKLHKPTLKIALLEKESNIASHQTGRNSGVIHSGIYYKPNSLKAISCKRGYSKLIDFCNDQGVDYDLCGKIIVATNEVEISGLHSIYEKGVSNGLTGIKKINSHEINEIEPYCSGLQGVYVPQTGIIDYTAVTNKYAELFKNLDGEIFLNEKVVKITPNNKGSVLTTMNHDFKTKHVINCAGLYSDVVAKMVTPKLDIKILPFRGEYYNIKKEKQYLVNNLIYPVPNPNFPFLGVHFTRMINGGIEAGPNAVLAFAREGYSNRTVNWSELFETLGYSGFQKVALKYWKDGLYEMYRSYSKKAFTTALQQLIPDISIDDIESGNAGVRAQACDKKGNLLDDFYIFNQDNIINVCNAPSPAATSSIMIGESIVEIAIKNFL